MIFKHKGGATAKVQAYTPAARELVIDTTTKRLVVGDGTTAGGLPVSADMSAATGTLAVANGGTGQTDVSFVRAEDTTSVGLTSNTFVLLSPTEVTDTKNAYVNGVWTCPADGYYQINGFVRFGTATTKTCSRMIKIDSATAPTTSAVIGRSVSATAGDADVTLEVSALLYVTKDTAFALYAYNTDTAQMFALQKALQIIRIR